MSEQGIYRFRVEQEGWYEVKAGSLLDALTVWAHHVITGGKPDQVCNKDITAVYNPDGVDVTNRVREACKDKGQ